MTCPSSPGSQNLGRIAALDLDVRSLAAVSPEANQEQMVAIHDLIADNQFALVDGCAGPYGITLSTKDNKLVFDVADQPSGDRYVIALSVSPFRRIVRDYLMMCDSYYDAVRHARPEQIETVDMARRATHNEGAELLIERLDGKASTDFPTARRLFTLMCALFRSR